MKNGEQVFLEITNGENLVKIELSKSVKQNAEHDWDKNYIRAIVNFKSDTFQNKFETQFMTVDFEKFKRDLKRIYHSHNGTATFESLEDPMKLIINGEGNGHFSIEYLKNETSTLKFDLPFNGIQIVSLIRQLEKITAAFPIIGNEFRMTNASHYNNDRPLQTKSSSMSPLHLGLASVI